MGRKRNNRGGEDQAAEAAIALAMWVVNSGRDVTVARVVKKGPDALREWFRGKLYRSPLTQPGQAGDYGTIASISTVRLELVSAMLDAIDWDGFPAYLRQYVERADEEGLPV